MGWDIGELGFDVGFGVCKILLKHIHATSPLF